MSSKELANLIYDHNDRQVVWQGIKIVAGDVFDSFITKNVASRLRDEEVEKDFRAHLRGLATTGFARTHLEAILAAEVPEERDWAVGESVAEAYLEKELNVTWPWNMQRDKRTPKASLPGADLIGFEIIDNTIRLVLGEVKTSADVEAPPNVMNGRSGMIHQIDNVAHNLRLINRLFQWLFIRCRGTDYQTPFDAAILRFIHSGNKDVALFGVLIRDTQPNEMDLRSRGQSLAGILQNPTTCKLLAIYLPCTIADLPVRVLGEGS